MKRFPSMVHGAAVISLMTVLLLGNTSYSQASIWSSFSEAVRRLFMVPLPAPVLGISTPTPIASITPSSRISRTASPQTSTPLRAQILAAVQDFFAQGVSPELAAALRGPKGDQGVPGIQAPSGFGVGAVYPTATTTNVGTIGGVTFFSTQDLTTQTLTAAGNVTVKGSTILTGGLNVSGSASISSIILNGTKLSPSGVTSNSVDFSELKDGLTLDANTTVASNGFSLTFGNGSLKGDGQKLTLAHIGNSTFSTIQDLQNLFHSAGLLSGGTITDLGGGTISTAAGQGTIRTSNSSTAQVKFFDWPASSSMVVPNNTHQNVGVIYNNGSPKLAISSVDGFFDTKTGFEIGEVVNENGQISITFNPQAPGDHPATMIKREYETMPVMRDMLGGGLILSESGDGNRTISMSAGAVWDRLNRFSINAVNTGGSGHVDRYYRDGSGGFVKESAQTQWPNQTYDNNSGTLATLASGKFGVLWFYVNTSGDLMMIYGRGQYASVRAAEQEQAPEDRPVKIEDENTELIGRIIFQKNASTATAVQSSFTDVFPALDSQVGISVNEGTALFDNIASITFNPGSFNVNANTINGVATVSLDWVNGPASRSIAQTITGAWTFSAPNTGLTISTGASVSGVLEATTLKSILLGSDSGLTISPTTTLHINPGSGITHIVGVASVSGNFYDLGNVGIGTTNPTSRLSIVGTGSDLNSNAIGVTNAAGSSVLTVLNNGSIGIGATTTDQSGIRVRPITLTGAATLSTVGSSTTVTTTGGAFADVYTGSSITANGITRFVSVKVDNNTITLSQPVDWSAGYSFTYNRSPIISVDDPNDTESRAFTFTRGTTSDWTLLVRHDETGQNFYIRNGQTGKDTVTLTEKGTMALNLPSALASATPDIPATLSLYTQPFDRAWFFQGGTSTYSDITSQIANSEDVAGVFSIAANTDFLYLGSLRKFSNAFFERVAGPNTGVLKAEYWNGASWVTVGGSMGFTDNTNGLTQSGNVAWRQNQLTGWTTNSVNGSSSLYYVRLSFTTYIGGSLQVNFIVPNGTDRLDVYKAPSDADPAFSINGLGRVGLGDRVRATRLSDNGNDTTSTSALSVIDTNGLVRIWAYDTSHPAGLELVSGTGSVSNNIRWDIHVASASGPYNTAGFVVEHNNGSGKYAALTLNPINVSGTSATAATLAGTLGAMTGNQLMTGLSLAFTNGAHSGTGNQVHGLDIGTLTSSTASESAIYIHSGYDYAFVASQGNVGIGTLTPRVKLDVVGTASISQFFGSGLTSCTGSNKLVWSNGSFSCVPESGGGTDFTANQTITGFWQFANNVSVSAGNLEIRGFASASSVFGAGLSSCAGAGSKLLWNNGAFSCGTDIGAGGGSTIGVNEVGSAFTDVSSLSFNAAHFVVTPVAPDAVVSLDWGNGGPASRSIAQTISGAWNFTGGASISTNPFEVGSNVLYVSPGTNRVGINTQNLSEALEIAGNASISGNLYSLGNVGIGTNAPTAGFRLDATGAIQVGDGTNTTQTVLGFNVGHSMTLSYARNQFNQTNFDGLRVRNGSTTESNLFTVYGSQSAQVISNAQGDGFDSQFIAMNNPDISNLTNATQGLFTNKATTHDIAIQYRFGTNTPLDAILIDTNPAANVINSIIVNNDNGNVPFRVAGQNDANLLYVDGSHKVGIGTSAPLTKLEVQGTASASNLLTIGGLQVGNGASVSYSRFGTSTTLHGLSSVSDLLVSGHIEGTSDAFFDGTASVSGNFEVASAASTSKLFGAGLTTCNGTFSALRYDASTGLFVCGTEGGGVRTESSETTVLANNNALNFDASMFSLAASGSTETNIRLNWTNGPASRSANQTITGAWTFGAANTGLTVSNNASVSGTLEASALKVDTLSNSTGTLQINAFTLGGLVTGNNQTITGIGQLNTTNASASSTIEAITLKAGTLGADAGLTISPTGQLTLTPGTRTQINGSASISQDLELTAVTSKLGINAGGSTDTTLEVGGTASISGKVSLADSVSVSANVEAMGYTSASQYFGAGLTSCNSYGNRLQWNNGQFSCATSKVQATYTSGVINVAATAVTDAGIFTPTNNTAFSVAIATNAASSSFRAVTGGSFVGCSIVSDAAVTAGAVSVVFRVDGVTVGNGYCRLSTSNNRAKSETIPGNTVTFVAGDDIGVAASSSGLAPTTGDYAIYWTVAYGSGADLAETYYTNDDTLIPGMVVAMDSNLFDGVRRSSGAYDAKTLGVISEAPGLLIGDTDGPGRKVNVALSGRVPAYVSTENGPIRAGDWLTASSVPGAAMRATKSGQVIGQALTDFSGEGIGKVLMFVKNSQYLGAAGSAVAGASSSSLLTDLMQQQSLAASVSMNSLVRADRVLVEHDVVAPTMVTHDLTADILHMGSTSISAVDLMHMTGDLASQSAEISSANMRIDALTGRVSDVWARLASVSVAPSIDLVSLVASQSSALAFSSIVAFHGGVQVDSISSANDAISLMNDTIFMGHPYVTADTAGSVLFDPDTRRAIVVFDHEYLQAPVVTLTVALPVSSSAGADDLLSQNIRTVVAQSGTTGFTILLDHAPSIPIQINWIALAVKDPRIIHSQPEPTRTPLVVPSLVPTATPDLSSTASSSDTSSVSPSDTPAPTASISGSPPPTDTPPPIDTTPTPSDTPAPSTTPAPSDTPTPVATPTPDVTPNQ